MDRLRFLGRGSAFNPKEGNTSAYYIENKHLILLDCGETVYSDIVKVDLLKDIEKVDIFITHLHSDHVGSLSSLIYYLYYVKNIVPTVTFPIKKQLIDYLEASGNVEGIHYIINGASKYVENIEITPNKVSHYELFKDTETNRIVANSFISKSSIKNVFHSYGYYLKSPDKKIYYSGDSNEFNIDLEDIDIVYQDCALTDREDYPHLTFNQLCEKVKKEDRHKVKLMHIDNDDIFSLAFENGFEVVDLENEPSIYILKTISLHKKTEEDLIKEWKIRNIKYTKREVSYEDHLKYLKSWNEDKFGYNEEDNCYFNDLEVAKSYAIGNAGDMNDGGLYDYVVILKTALDRTYAMTNCKEAYLFKFNYNTCLYEPVEFNDSEEGRLIVKKLNISWLFE